MSGYRIVGFAGDDRTLVGQSLVNPTVLGLTSDLRQLVRQQRVHRVVIALDEKRGCLPLESLLAVKALDGVAVEDSDAFYERMAGRLSPRSLRPANLIFTAEPLWRGIYRRIRTLLDIVLAAIALVLVLPLMVLTALVIKLDSRGPVFYRQERMGLLNRRFQILKFRSMVDAAEKNGAVWAEEKDRRITRIGQIIRKIRIDELPQLINILRGEMGLIGPRPERPEFLEQLESEIPYYSQRHLLRPGITGWAQVCYPYGASVDDAREKFSYDMYYLKHQSPMLDAIILVETIKIVLFGRLAR